MIISNLIFNVNYRKTVGQSSIVDHLLTYSAETGCLPQKINDMWDKPIYIYRDKEGIVGLPHLDPDIRFSMKEDNFVDIIKEKISDCTDIERNPILESNFTFLLPGSIFPGLWMEDDGQRKFFVKQPIAYYVWEYNKRFKNRSNTTLVNESNLGRIRRTFDLEDATYLETLNMVANKINSKDPGSAIDFIKDKPLTLAEIANSKGFEYAIEEGTKEFKKDFFDIEINEDTSEVDNITIDVNKLLVNDKNASIDYYKYMCKELAITSNLDLYDQFHDYFIDTDDYTRLNMITNSDYITDILYNEFKDRI